MVTGLHACHCGVDGCQRDAENRESGFFDGMAEHARIVALSVAKAGVFEQQDLAQRLIGEAQAIGLARPVQEPVQVKRWHE